ncbi:MAG: hypothetical protein ACHQRJ_23300 [Alphaproteobacteria bacterium]
MFKKLFVPIIGMLLIGISAAHGAGDPPTGADQSPRVIGMAMIKPNGTIIIDIYGGPETNYALGHLEYRPTDPNYGAVLHHLGGLKPGETKGVPPWPD